MHVEVCERERERARLYECASARTLYVFLFIFCGVCMVCDCVSIFCCDICFRTVFGPPLDFGITEIIPKSRVPRCGSGPNRPLEGVPHPTIATGGPSLKPQPFPAHPLPPFPQPPWLFSQCSGRGGARLVWGRGPRPQRGGGGGPSKRHLGSDPHLGLLDKTTLVSKGIPSCPILAWRLPRILAREKELLSWLSDEISRSLAGWT